MGTLYIDRRDMRIKREGVAIAMYQGSERRGTVPMSLLERVVTRGKVELDTDLLGELAEQGVGLLVLSGRHGRRLATLLGRPHADAARRVAQYRGYANPAWRIVWSRRLVRHKLRAQARLLRLALAERPDQRYALAKGLGSIEPLVQALVVEDVISLDRIRGLEGAGAAAYFGAYTQLFADTLKFRGRNRRPPRDPVNACLSLGYTMMHFEAVLACHAAGLDPLVGFFHELTYGRESLAADLLEPLRPRVDHWVWELFRTRKLRDDHFSRHGQACLLGKSGRQVFYAHYETFARPLRRLLRRATMAVAKRLVAGDMVEEGAA